MHELSHSPPFSKRMQHSSRTNKWAGVTAATDLFVSRYLALQTLELRCYLCEYAHHTAYIDLPRHHQFHFAMLISILTTSYTHCLTCCSCAESDAVVASSLALVVPSSAVTEARFYFIKRVNASNDSLKYLNRAQASLVHDSAFTAVSSSIFFFNSASDSNTEEATQSHKLENSVVADAKGL